MIESIFRIPFYKVYLDIDNKPLVSLSKKLLKQNRIRNLSVLGGTQSDEISGKDKEVHSLAQHIVKHSKVFARHIGLTEQLTIGSMWANVGGYKDCHRVHHHPHSLIGGVYYVSAPKDCGNIRFYHPYYETMQYDWNTSTLNRPNEYSYGSRDLEAATGWLYLFPNWLNHSVEPNLNKKQKRISIAFNMFKNI